MMDLTQIDSPLQPQMWPGPDTCDWSTGLMNAGTYVDGAPVVYRWWDGHDLIAGATGSGKSSFTRLLLQAALHSGGLVSDWVIDPQQGQSLGDLQGRVDRFASDLPEARLLLQTLRDEVQHRWSEMVRRWQVAWAPSRETPLIVVTIEEAPMVLADPVCLSMVEQVAKLMRKTGVKLRLLAPDPSMTSLNHSLPVKDVVTAGQLWLFRTSFSVSGQVALYGAMDVESHMLPVEWPGVGYLLDDRVDEARCSMLMRTYHPAQ